MFAPKLRILAGFKHQIYNTNHRKLLVIFDWPITQWNVEMVLYTLGFKVLSIHSPAICDECAESFTTRGNNDEVQILVTSTASPAYPSTCRPFFNR